jgi:hypothetical protein
MKLAKRHGFDTALKDRSYVDMTNPDDMDIKMATLKAKIARRNNSMKSQTVLEKSSDRDLSPGGTQKYQSGKILALTNGDTMTQKKTSKREGLLRLVNSIGENFHEHQAAEERKMAVINKNILREYSRTGNLTTLMKRKDSRNDSFNSRSGSLDSPDKVTVSSMQNKMLGAGNIISIRDFPPTSRYILKNIFGSTKTNSPREGMKDVINNLRTLFYT